MFHMHHSQPLTIKFGNNHFLGTETLVPIEYRERVKQKFLIKSPNFIRTKDRHRITYVLVS